MTDRTCSVDGCDKPRHSKGLCSSHAHRLRRHGNPLAGGRRRSRIPGDTLEQKLLLNHTVDPESGCWRWTRNHDAYGYGQLSLGPGSSPKGVHRLAHELWVGPIPDGYQVDHVLARGCVHRDCLNPAHLEAVTPRENTLRGATLPAANAAKTHCPQGHAYDEVNTYRTAKGQRVCRQCRDRHHVSEVTR